MNELYPKINPYNEFSLPVSDIHTLNVEESGNPNGKKILVIHGGPGGSQAGATGGPKGAVPG